MKIIENVPYSNEQSPARTMDLYIPDHQKGESCILFIHGGGWITGHKLVWRSVAEYFCERGYLCASMGYRLAPEYQFPSQMEDARLAVSYLRSNAEQYGFRSDSIIAFGGSAGGYMAIMLALISAEDSTGYSAELKFTDTAPCAVVAYCPVTDLNLDLDIILQYMGCKKEDDPALYREASPMERVKSVQIPMLIIHGDHDELIPLQNSVEFSGKMKLKGSPVELDILPGVGHGFGYGIDTEAQKESLEMVQQFLDRNSL